MIDLHCHILPGIDDGAKDWDIALEMVRIAAADGIHTIVATPHHRNGIYDNDADTIRQLTAELNDRIQAAQLGIQILPGSETHYHANFITDLRDGHILTVNDAPYVYLELPYQEVPRYIQDMVFEITVQGYTPILPHPERNRAFRRDPDRLYELIEAGAISQVTAGSLTGYYGEDVKKFSMKLFQHGLSHLVASDAHGVKNRRPVLQEAYTRLRKQVGQDAVDTCLANAVHMVHGDELILEQSSPIRRKKLFGII